MAWDVLPGGGFIFGFPPALAAVYLGVQVRQGSENGRRKALAAVLIGGAMLVMMTVWLIVESL